MDTHHDFVWYDLVTLGDKVSAQVTHRDLDVTALPCCRSKDLE
jgi:hypothetical protein